VGGKLDIKPELSYDLNGALTLRGMCRGRKKALRAILQDFRDNYAHDTSLPLAIVSTDARKDADWLDAQVRKEKGCEDVTIIHSTVSPILGSHVGPGMVALVFWGTDRREKVSLTDRIARKVRKGSAGRAE
jgi:fatty acid-binding protein DegV